MNSLTKLNSITQSLNKYSSSHGITKSKLKPLYEHFKLKIENFITKLILKKSLKDIKIKYNKLTIDFYKSYNGTEVHLVSLLIKITPYTNFLTPTSFLNFNLITYPGNSSENWEYQKLIDIGNLSNVLFKNKEKILKILNTSHPKYLTKRKEIHNKMDKLRNKIIDLEIKHFNLLYSSLVNRLKSSFIDFTNIIYKDNKGYLPDCLIVEDNFIFKNVTSIKLIKGSKYKLLYTTTELDKSNNPIIWEVEYDNLEKPLRNLIRNIPNSLFKFILK